MPEIRAVVFDIGEVLIKLDFSKVMALRGLSPNQSLSEWLHQMNSWDLYDAFERGTVTETEFIRELSIQLKVKLDRKTFLPIWNSVLQTTVFEVEAILAKLAITLPVYGLTNSNATHIQHAQENFPVMKHFKKVFTSYELKARKPEAKIYLGVEKQTALKGKNILFIDDRAENVEGARKAGWNAELCVTSPSDIKSILKKYGI